MAKKAQHWHQTRTTLCDFEVQSHIKPEHDLADRLGGMQFSIQGDFSTLRFYRVKKGRNGDPATWVRYEAWKPFELSEGEVIEYRVEGLKAAIDKLTVHWETIAQPLRR
jgi:hypothetical protein